MPDGFDAEGAAGRFSELFATGRGRPVAELEAEIRATVPPVYARLDASHLEFSVEHLARYISGPGWARHRPWEATGLAWRHRHHLAWRGVLRPFRRPRLAG